MLGAPCGIMDQMTSALGRRDRLLRLRCQPATVEGHVTVPAGYRFYGIDSGIRHAVTGADYGTVRTAAFMGYRIIADFAGLPATVDGDRVSRAGRSMGRLSREHRRRPSSRRGSRSGCPTRMRGADSSRGTAGSPTS